MRNYILNDHEEGVLYPSRNRTHSGKIYFNPQYLSFAGIAGEVIESAKTNHTRISIDISLSDEIIVFADAGMLFTVLRNFVSFAAKLTTRDGTINIKAEKNPGYITISVSDNGIGMSPEKMKNLFDIKKAQTQMERLPEESSSDFGLLICKEFVEKHGGRIWVESRCGRGTEFLFTLPE